MWNQRTTYRWIASEISLVFYYCEQQGGYKWKKKKMDWKEKINDKPIKSLWGRCHSIACPSGIPFHTNLSCICHTLHLLSNFSNFWCLVSSSPPFFIFILFPFSGSDHLPKQQIGHFYFLVASQDLSAPGKQLYPWKAKFAELIHLCLPAFMNLEAKNGGGRGCHIFKARPLLRSKQNWRTLFNLCIP